MDENWTPTSTWEDYEEQVEQDKLRFRELCLIRVGHEIAQARMAGAKSQYEMACAELEAAIERAYRTKRVLETAITYLAKTTASVGNTKPELEALLQ